VQAVVGWYGIYDFLDEEPIKRPPPPPEDPVRLFLGCATAPCTDAQKRNVSPVTYIDKGDAPMLLIHGSDDFAVPPHQSEIMAAKLTAAGVPAEVKIIQGVGHGWFGKSIEDTRTASREAMKYTMDYFDARLGATR
jgi:dienelactone hydrolase